MTPDNQRQTAVNERLFDRLDQLLPAQRSASGTPSTTDFFLHEMPTIIDRLASVFEEATIPAVPGSDVRVFLTIGVFVADVAVYVAESPDGSIEILWLDID